MEFFQSSFLVFFRRQAIKDSAHVHGIGRRRRHEGADAVFFCMPNKGGLIEQRLGWFRPNWMMPPQNPEEAPLAGVLDRNIQTLAQQRREEEIKIGPTERIAQTITRFTGSMRFVIVHVVIFGSWILANCGYISSLAFDPEFSKLSLIVAIEAIFLSTFVLMNQNRIIKMEGRRNDLSLQVGLLAEHEITHVLHLVKGIAEKLHLDHARNPELEELQQPVSAKQILSEIESQESTPPA